MEFKQLERTGTAAVKRLRLKKLQNGLPFMINSKELPGNQCYLEYPNGSIKLVTMDSSTRDFKVLRELSKGESAVILAKYHLS